MSLDLIPGSTFLWYDPQPEIKIDHYKVILYCRSVRTKKALQAGINKKGHNNEKTTIRSNWNILASFLQTLRKPKSENSPKYITMMTRFSSSRIGTHKRINSRRTNRTHNSWVFQFFASIRPRLYLPGVF